MQHFRSDPSELFVKQHACKAWKSGGRTADGLTSTSERPQKVGNWLHFRQNLCPTTSLSDPEHCWLPGLGKAYCDLWYVLPSFVLVIHPNPSSALLLPFSHMRLGNFRDQDSTLTGEYICKSVEAVNFEVNYHLTFSKHRLCLANSDNLKVSMP
ncbi:unnamed protein product [Protopolystoma xenopodis]|uniref:Uncharacterized protein n=1 Tax=Protopolystoma xenopodis TaxID=117903 RepID=A0A3S5A8X2_9PLAT|nr:unnamed protein product [Protopolystoma xenopodis]